MMFDIDCQWLTQFSGLQIANLLARVCVWWMPTTHSPFTGQIKRHKMSMCEFLVQFSFALHTLTLGRQSAVGDGGWRLGGILWERTPSIWVNATKPPPSSHFPFKAHQEIEEAPRRGKLIPFLHCGLRFPNNGDPPVGFGASQDVHLFKGRGWGGGPSGVNLNCLPKQSETNSHKTFWPNPTSNIFDISTKLSHKLKPQWQDFSHTTNKLILMRGCP